MQLIKKIREIIPTKNSQIIIKYTGEISVSQATEENKMFSTLKTLKNKIKTKVNFMTK